MTEEHDSRTPEVGVRVEAFADDHQASKERRYVRHLCDVPENFVAEMFDGDLYASPRPALPHTNAAGSLFAEIHSAFHNKRPGG